MKYHASEIELPVGILYNTATIQTGRMVLTMTDAQQREAARQFFYKWNGKGREDEDARSYWIDILQAILGVEKVTDRVDFEKKVLDKGSTRRIDVYIPETHVLIEQKSLGIPLDKPQAGHDGDDAAQREAGEAHIDAQHPGQHDGHGDQYRADGDGVCVPFCSLHS